MPQSDTPEQDPTLPSASPAQTRLAYATLGPEAWMLSEVERFFGFGIDDPAQRRQATVTALAAAQANYNAFAATMVEPGTVFGCEIEVKHTDGAAALSYFTTLPNPIELLEVLIHNATPGDMVTVRQIMAGSSTSFATQAWPFGLDLAEKMVAPRSAAIRAAARSGNSLTSRALRLTPQTSLSYTKRHGPPKWSLPKLTLVRDDNGHARGFTFGWRYTSYTWALARQSG